MQPENVPILQDLEPRALFFTCRRERERRGGAPISAMAISHQGPCFLGRPSSTLDPCQCAANACPSHPCKNAPSYPINCVCAPEAGLSPAPHAKKRQLDTFSPGWSEVFL